MKIATFLTSQQSTKTTYDMTCVRVRLLLHNYVILLLLTAKPKNLSVSTLDGRDISSTSIIGPFNEGFELRLVCESGGGKPIPRVTWFNGSKVISGKILHINL